MNKITVITVTYNNQRTIKSCLDSVIKYAPGSEVIVVDNGSIDSTLELIEKFGKKVQVRETGRNLGFSKANNLGAKEAKGEYLIFLNPDTRILKFHDLQKLQELLEKNPEYGILGPKLVYPDNTLQSRVRNLPTVSGAFKEYILGIEGTYNFYAPKGQSLCEVESVIGACLVISKELFFKVGGFNEKYFMYYEDLQLCKEVREKGLKVGFVPEVVVVHAEGVSGQNQKTKELMKVSAKKYFGLPTYFLLEFIFTYNRLVNKMRQVGGHKVHA